NAVGGNVGETRDFAGRPDYLDLFDDFRGAEPEMRARVIAGGVAAAGLDFASLRLVSARDRNAGADSKTIALGAREPDQDPVISLHPLIHQKRRIVVKRRH